MEESFIENLDGGRFLALSDEAAQKVLNDICDLNKPHNCKREVTMTLSFLPSKNEKKWVLVYKITTKLAPEAQEETTLYIGTKDGIAISSPHDLRQMRLPMERDDNFAN
jgi:hypothetical protein